MQKKMYLLLIVLFFTSCHDEKVRAESNKTEENITKSQKNSIEKNSTMKKSTILEEMGIEFSETKLIIDINKTSNFFGTLEKRLEKKAEDFEQKVENKINNMDINLTRDMGIDIRAEEINIDLNKTKNMLDNISHIFENILFESNSTKF